MGWGFLSQLLLTRNRPRLLPGSGARGVSCLPGPDGFLPGDAIAAVGRDDAHSIRVEGRAQLSYFSFLPEILSDLTWAFFLPSFEPTDRSIA